MRKNVSITEKSLYSKKLVRRLPWLALIPLGFLLPRLASSFPEATEAVYSRIIYPAVHFLLSGFSSLFPFSLAEFILYALSAGVIFLTLYQCIRCIFRRIAPIRLAGYFLSLFIAAGAMLNLFYFSWGFQYSRPPLSQLMSLPVKERPVEELELLCTELAQTAARLRDKVTENENGVFVLSMPLAAYFDAVPDDYARLSQSEPFFNGKVFPPKCVTASVGLSYAGIAGIFIPFTGESNVNVDQPAMLLISSAAHEAAHSLGIAREDEANFAAYLACNSSENPETAYSGVMLALIHCGNQLYAADGDKYAALYYSYSAAMLRDMNHYNAYWSSFEGPVDDTFSQINDNYLKFNQQELGVKSYGAMVDLMLAYRFR